ncbi:roadblock/LC7 domain-containing protein [Isoptericola jiangsuensis]|uniref:roadblock/LC7 domain-containing protein n=1 Tax=Bacteria TaxID=2 RepID=UPI00190B4DE7|nr:roadblock/LC7 domain-containing protein [Stenotrophomonas sp. S41]MBK0013611.1 roadblock/LC7 domain-containing protein [Stenotrophomonas sp. S41]
MADGQVATLPDAGQRERLQPLLQDLQRRVEGVRTVVLASVDGFALVSAGADGRSERLAAMTSAMLALAAAVGRELALGDLQTLMLEALGGKVLMLAIQTEGRAPLLLMAACDQRSVIGQVLWQSRECGQAILAELSGS